MGSTMASSLRNSPAATTLDVEDLVQQAWSGGVRVPHFQRDFRWGWEDIRRLFDSIIRGYPLGSLLLWLREAPSGVVQLGSIRIDAPSSQRALWVVDGQQRLTSIANALHPEAGREGQFALAYDLKREAFTKPPKVFDPYSIPLPTLFDLQQVILWFAENPVASSYLEAATKVTKILRQYELPVYIVETEDVSVLQDIFDRMNNYGKRLTRAEVFTALNATSDYYQDDRLTLDGIAAGIDQRFDFGVIDNDTVLACVLARRGPEIRRDIRNEFERAGDEGLEAAYANGEAAMHRAVQFLQDEACVPHYTLVAYRYLLVVLSRFFALHSKPSPRNIRLLRRWFWQAAVAGPGQFKGGTPNAARILCGRIDEANESGSVQRLLSTTAETGSRAPEVRRFAASEAATKILLCGMWSLAPRNPVSAEPYTHADLSSALTDSRTAQPAVRSILVKSVVPDQLRPWAANRVLMPSLTIDSRELWSMIVTQPVDISAEEWEGVLRSHCLSDEALALLTRSAVTKFLEHRQKDIELELQSFVSRMCEREFENTPPLSALNLDEGLDVDDK